MKAEELMPAAVITVIGDLLTGRANLDTILTACEVDDETWDKYEVLRIVAASTEEEVNTLFPEALDAIIEALDQARTDLLEKLKDERTDLPPAPQPAAS